MAQRDYILRLIEQLGPLSNALLNSAELRKGQQYRAAGETIERALRQHFGLSLATVRQLAAEELVGLLRLGQSNAVAREVFATKLALLASLLREQADVDSAEGDEAAAVAGRRTALHLLLVALTEEGGAGPAAAEAITPLLAQLAEEGVHTPTKELLWRYYEQIGAFGRAEDWLFALLDDEPATLEQGIAFYERLGHHRDAELAAGNLPREEVAASLAELRARRGE